MNAASGRRLERVLKIGVALGGGGAKGLAHIPILEAFDELGLRPAAISGTSMGAIIGALYASGQSAAEIRESLGEMLFSVDEGGRPKLDLFKSFQALRQLVDFDFSSGGVMSGDYFLSALSEELGVATFEELEIPLFVVATDFWAREQVIFDSGALPIAVRASMSLPAIFTPVVHEGRVLMDGGSVNPVPYDLLFDHCDRVLAVDVSGSREEKGEDELPSASESVFNTFQIMSRSILEQKLRIREPDLLVRPPIVDVKVLEFSKANEVYQQTEGCRRQVSAWLRKLTG